MRRTEAHQEAVQKKGLVVNEPEATVIMTTVSAHLLAKCHGHVRTQADTT